ncbi:MAG: cytochrome c-type biogenesis protein [Acidimicrobiales bacterium]
MPGAGRLRLPWVALVLLVAAVLVYGAWPVSAPQTVSEKVASIASQVRCPTCKDVSAEASNASTALAVRAAIRRRVAKGEPATQIEAFLVRTYGPQIMLRPPSTGLASVVWVLPVAAGLLAAAGVGVVVFRRRQSQRLEPSAEDEDLVARARR